MRHESSSPGRAGSSSRLSTSIGCALQGWIEAWRHQANLRIHAAFVLAVTGLGLYLRLTAVQWALLALTCSLVLTAEILNSALEALTDLASPGYHPLAGHAKDMAAGAVLMAAMGAVVVGLLVLGPPLWTRIARFF